VNPPFPCPPPHTHTPRAVLCGLNALDFPQFTMEGPPVGSVSACPGLGIRAVARIFDIIKEREEHFE
jgi:hypothetical protein